MKKPVLGQWFWVSSSCGSCERELKVPHHHRTFLKLPMGRNFSGNLWGGRPIWMVRWNLRNCLEPGQLWAYRFTEEHGAQQIWDPWHRIMEYSLLVLCESKPCRTVRPRRGFHGYMMLHEFTVSVEQVGGRQSILRSVFGKVRSLATSHLEHGFEAVRYMSRIFLVEQSFTYSFRSPCFYHQGRRIPSWVKFRCSQVIMLHELTHVHIFGVVKYPTIPVKITTTFWEDLGPV